MWATLSLPVPRTQPETSLPREIISMMESCSTSQSGSSQMGMMLPSSTILAREVTRARMAASMFIAPPMQKGVLWCSLSIKPSKPISSA